MYDVRTDKAPALFSVSQWNSILIFELTDINVYKSETLFTQLLYRVTFDNLYIL